ncbi:hypothetical protein IWW38_006131, partial [Coemansia aciculifera]
MERCCENAPSALPLSGAVTANNTTSISTSTSATIYAQVAMHIANTLALRPTPTSADCTNCACPIAYATDYIWQLGLQCPASGLVPTSDYDKVLILHFLGLWTTRVLPLLLNRPESNCALPLADLSVLSKCILSRRHSLKQRGPFWNGRELSIAEVTVAPFADDILHSGLLPDSSELGPLCAWLAAVRASPV